MIFAVTLALLAPLMLGVFDIYLASTQRTRLQDALDAAALFAARSPGKTSAAVDAVGDAALLANLSLPNSATIVASTFALQGDTVVAHAEVEMPALAAGLWPHENLRATSEVVRSLDRLELALVLDNTGSMSGKKLATLKTSAKDLVDKLEVAAARSPQADPLKMSLVPFSMTVRVQDTTSVKKYKANTHSGPGIPTWIDPEGKAHVAAGKDIFNTQSDRMALLKAMGEPWEGCVEARRQPYDVQETAPTTSTPATRFVPYFWPDEPDANDGFSGYPNDYLDDATSSSSWSVRELNAAKYKKSPRSGSFRSGYEYGPNAGCGLQPIVRLTTSSASIKSAIDDMTAVGDTNIPLGMAWGWRMLSPNAPFADGTPYSTPHVRKIIILMTDGVNTMGDPSSGWEQNKSYYSGLGYIWQGLLGVTSANSGTRTNRMDDRLALLCDNVKAKDIVVYTVRVEVRSGESSLLEDCASSPDKFYDVQDVADLSAAFDSIAGSIDNLRLTR
ncbi:pilus assembly protein TadG-related protein [Phenylobacterium sp.]|uniref:pilus assembly protein TadG-related protein n=1 Tax=Phenylobacterium sp. TaxID=1871053 RepID=UPI0030F3BC45